jgi:hypothetical protein
MSLEDRNVTNAFHMCRPVILHARGGGAKLRIWWPSDAAKLQGRGGRSLEKSSHEVWSLESSSVEGSGIRGQLPGVQGGIGLFFARLFPVLNG